jgi:hypothetical protein
LEELLLLVQKTYGLVGLLIIAPFVGLVYLFRQNVKLHDDVVKAIEKVGSAQEQRVNDAQAINLKLLDVVKEQSALNTEANVAMERLGDALNDIQNRLIDKRP